MGCFDPKQPTNVLAQMFGSVCRKGGFLVSHLQVLFTILTTSATCQVQFAAGGEVPSPHQPGPTMEGRRWARGGAVQWLHVSTRRGRTCTFKKFPGTTTRLMLWAYISA